MNTKSKGLKARLKQISPIVSASFLALLGSGACLLMSMFTSIHDPWKMTWAMEALALMGIGAGIPALHHAGIMRKKTPTVAKVILNVNMVAQGALATFIHFIVVRDEVPCPLFLIISLLMMAVFCIASFAIVLGIHSGDESQGD